VNEHTDAYINNELAEALAKADDYLQLAIEEIDLENMLFAQEGT
jgi:hypothetical protein